MWFQKLNTRKVKLGLILLVSVLFMASAPGSCETAHDSTPVIDDSAPIESKSPFAPGPRDTAVFLADGVTRLAWAQDGEHIMFSSGGLLGVYIVDSAGLELRAFPETAPEFGDWEQPGAFAPSISPDGSRVAYSVFAPWNSTVIETAAFDGSDVRRLTPLESHRDPFYQHSVYPVWSPDSKHIAFVSNRIESLELKKEIYGFRLFIMGADGSNLREVAPLIEIYETDLQSVVWSPDSTRIAFVGREANLEYDHAKRSLYILKPDGSGLTRLAEFYVREMPVPAWSAPVWSPNSNQLAFRTWEEDHSLPVLYTVRADGSSLSRVAVTVGWPAWSPDGTWLAFPGLYYEWRRESFSHAIFVARYDASDMTRVAVKSLGPVVWTPEGEEIWYEETWSDGHWYAVRPDGSGLREVIPGGVMDVVQTAWSPEGTVLALLSLKDDGQFWLHMAARDGKAKRVLARGTADQLVAEHSDWSDTSGEIAACAEVYSGNLGLAHDCQTLLRIRDALAGEALLNWKASVPIQHWQGIVVDGSPPRVRGLHFGYSESNTLTGVISPEIGSLSALVDLRLINQRLSGEIPSEIGNLQNLKVLNLGSNSLSGPVPSEIGDLSELTTLILSENDLSGSVPKSLGRLAKLGGLNLSKNPLEGGIPAEIGNLKQLTHLRMCCTNLEGSIPPEIGGLTNLRVLDLKFNYLTGTIPPELGSLENLVNLYLYANFLSGCVPAVLSERLQDFDLRGLDFCE